MKRLLLWGAFVVTLIAVYFAPQEDDGVAVAVAPAKDTRRSIQPVAMLSTTSKLPVEDYSDLRIHPRSSDEDLGNVFAAHSWAPPAPIPDEVQKAAPPPEPEAPPLPFRFLGRLVEDGRTAYFLQFNDRNLVMRIGDAIDNTYKLESNDGGTLTFAYLPLDKKQTLAVGEVD